ncbi:STAS domain-containing protein [Peribacillus sp. SCS-155]|uniref:STAS domain-containing protein n=1 Tax=Peribacillus sedimenti TaxID=3115297 RepID=UPI0039061F21
MKHELRYIGEKIVTNHIKLAEAVFESIDPAYSVKLKEAGMPIDELLNYRAELLRYFGQALYEDTDSMVGKAVEWGIMAAEFAIRYNVSLSDSLRAVSFYRTVIWEVFTEELEKNQFAAITMLDVSKKVDPLLDKVCSTIGEVYENHSNELMKHAYSALEELSVPVVPISTGIAVIPLVGAIDTNRAQLIMETSLSESARLSLQTIIMDISGVPVIDTMVANEFIKIISALKMTGIQAIITGIRPEIAQTIVNLGVHIGDVKTRANMQQALYELGFRQEKQR